MGAAVSRRTVLSGAAALALSAPMVGYSNAARAETKHVKIMLDWIIQGTHAPWFVAKKKGYFEKHGVIVDAIDPGKGATNVAVAVAGGAYQFGWVDMPSMILFNAKNPTAPLEATYISFDNTPLAVITRKDAGIRTPEDLNGKKIAGGPGTAVHDTISILLKAAHAENVKIDWVSVAPQLWGPMLKRGAVDGTGGFINSNVPAMLEIGFKMSQLFILKYSDFGANMYGLTVATPSKFAQENPDTVKGVVAALNEGTKDTIADPDAALKILQSYVPMMDMHIEKIRLDLALGLTDTPHVKKYGLSVVDPKKLQYTIDAICGAYDIKNKPSPASVYTPKFLPPLTDRQLSA